jgi:hypothetical protein
MRIIRCYSSRIIEEEEKPILLRTAVCFRDNSCFYMCHPPVSCTDFYHELVYVQYNKRYEEYFPIFQLGYSPKEFSLKDINYREKARKTYLFDTDQPLLFVKGSKLHLLEDNLFVLNKLEDNWRIPRTCLVLAGKHNLCKNLLKDELILSISPVWIKSPMLLGVYTKLLRYLIELTHPYLINNYANLIKDIDDGPYDEYIRQEFFTLDHYINSINLIEDFLDKDNLTVKFQEDVQGMPGHFHNFGLDSLNYYLVNLLLNRSQLREYRRAAYIDNIIRNVYNLFKNSNTPYYILYSKSYTYHNLNLSKWFGHVAFHHSGNERFYIIDNTVDYEEFLLDIGEHPEKFVKKPLVYES